MVEAGVLMGGARSGANGVGRGGNSDLSGWRRRRSGVVPLLKVSSRSLICCHGAPEETLIIGLGGGCAPLSLPF